MSTNPKTDADLAGTDASVNFLKAMASATPITDEMIAAAEQTNGPLPEKVRTAIKEINESLSDPNRITFTKDPSKFMLSGLEAVYTVAKAEKILKDWMLDNTLSYQFPIAIGCAILNGYHLQYEDIPEAKKHLLDCINHLRDTILGETGGR